MATGTPARTMGFDFGTTNSVAAIADNGTSDMLEFVGEKSAGAVFRSALCFWEDEVVPGDLAIMSHLRESGLLAIYEKAGFRIVGLHPDAIRQEDGTMCALYIMQKKL